MVDFEFPVGDSITIRNANYYYFYLVFLLERHIHTLMQLSAIVFNWITNKEYL